MIHEAGEGEERFDRDGGQRRGPAGAHAVGGGRFGGGADRGHRAEGVVSGRAPGPASPLAIALFGPFDVRLQGRPLPRPRSQKTHWLLALLVLQEGRALERGWLAGTLWPDSTEEQAGRNLRSSLWYLRQALGPEARRLEAPSTGTLRLDLLGAEADLLIFDEAIARGDAPSLEQAIALHRGPLLQGCEEEWVLQDREAREQAYLAALETLAAHALARGEHAQGVGYLRRLLAVDPLRESVQRMLMQALNSAGEYAAATQVYRDLRLLLHRELNAAPDPATTALYQQIRAGDRPPVRRTTTDHRPPSKAQHPTPNTQHPNTRLSSPRRLPSPWSSFIGRENEIAAVAAALTRGRLVTLTGTGGVGKTRLAIRVAAEIADDYAEGVWFVDLAGLSDPHLVAQAAATVLEVPERPGGPLVTALQEFLHPKQLLLVLDNCEHLVEACAQIADALLSTAPDLRILATSRQSLGLPGEVVWRVPSLAAPDPAHLPGDRDAEKEWVAILMEYAAIRLFVERACQADRAFAATPHNIRAIAGVCHRLDGIPLAVELAAARLKTMSLAQAAVRLEDHFGLLAAGSRSALPRQQTLRATMDWSYNLLSEPERTLLRRLSVFAGGFTLEAAEAVCSECGMRNAECGVSTDQSPSALRTPHSALRTEEVLDPLTSLIDKSLVQREEREGEGRYRLLETVRQYARDRLLEAGEGPTVRGRHLSFFLRLVQEAGLRLLGSEQDVWLDRLEREHDNLHAAIEWSLEVEEGWKEGMALMRDLFTYWDLRDRFGGAREYLERFVGRSADWPIAERERLRRLTGFVAMKQADYPAARRHFEESRTLRRQQGETEDPRDLQCYAALALHEGDYAQAAALLQQGLRTYREYQQAGREFKLNALGCHLGILGLVAYHQGEYPSARYSYEESLTLLRETDAKAGIASGLHGLGRVAMRQGEYSRARQLLQESLSLFRDVKVKYSAVEVLNSLMWVCWHEGDYAAARVHLGEALELCRETGRYSQTIDTLVSAGHLGQRQGNPARAVRSWGAAEALRAAIGEAMPPVERAEYEGAITAARAALGEDAFAAAWADGQAMTLEAAVTDALEG